MNKKNGIVSRENHPEFIDNAWRKITGWNEYYVHPTGFVKSIKININKRSYTKTTVEKILKTFTVKGYSSVNLVSNLKRKSARIHRLVMKGFVPNLENKPCINHKNGIKADNKKENLEWCTYSENESHSYNALGKISPATKLNAQDRYKIKKLYKVNKLKQTELAEMFKVTQQTISRILKK